MSLIKLTTVACLPHSYMGGSDPEKAFEQTCYAGGLYNYGKDIRAVLPGFEGFEVFKTAS